jgi:hypothetical protein
METLQIQQGVPFAVTLTLTDESVTPAVPMPLTGLTVFISVKELNDIKDDDSAAVISSKIVSHFDGANGITEWALTAAETMIRCKKYKADIRVYTSDEIYINSDQFYIEIVPTVTKRKV